MLNNSNIVGTYSEILVCSILGLDKQPNSRKSVDAIGNDGKKSVDKSKLDIQNYIQRIKERNEV